MAVERFGIDTSVLVRLVDGRSPRRQARARELVERAVLSGRGVLSVLSLGELFVLAVEEGLATPTAARQTVDDLSVAFAIVSPTAADARLAAMAAAAGHCAYRDGLLLATLDRAGCTMVLGECLEDGARLGGIQVRDPFAGDRLPEPIDRLLG